MSSSPRRCVPVFHLILTIFVTLPAIAAAREETPVPGTNTALIAESTVELAAGDLAWASIHRAVVADDAPAIPAHDGVLFAPDAPLLVLYEGESRVARLAPGEALALREGERVRPVAAQASPASMLAVGLAIPGDPAATPAPDDPWARLGEPFPVAVGEHIIALWRFELTTRPGRTLQQVERQIAALPYPAVLFVEQGEITGIPAGQTMSATVTRTQAIAVNGQSALAVSDDGAVILLVTLAPVTTGGQPGPETTPGSMAQTPTLSGTPTPSPTPDGTATAEATTEATTEATATTAPPPPDSDGDGLSDADEATRGTNPNSADTDGDTVDDAYEVDLGLDPTKPDSDGDGTGDADEVQDIEQSRQQGGGDADGDGLTDGYEGQVSLTDPNNRDSDFDGLFDGEEVNTYRSNALVQDTDGDGLTDGTDVSWGASPTNRDTDGDGLSDSFEVNQGTKPTSTDSDGDGVDDGYETGRGMNPNDGDSDGDSLGDGEEVNTYGSNPLNPDSDADGKGDGYEVQVCGFSPTTPNDFTDVIVC